MPSNNQSEHRLSIVPEMPEEDAHTVAATSTVLSTSDESAQSTQGAFSDASASIAPQMVQTGQPAWFRGIDSFLGSRKDRPEVQSLAEGTESTLNEEGTDEDASAHTDIEDDPPDETVDSATRGSRASGLKLDKTTLGMMEKVADVSRMKRKSKPTLPTKEVEGKDRRQNHRR